jgi:hypothetical protein
MARLAWYTVLLVIVAAIAAGTSWAVAYNTVDDVLGAPPPAMGKRSTRFLWEGVPRLPDRPRAWLFTFGPTRIPGAPNVRIYVSPTGRLLRTEPADLASRVKFMRGKGFN